MKTNLGMKTSVHQLIKNLTVYILFIYNCACMKKQITYVISSLFFISAGFVFDQLSSDIDTEHLETKVARQLTGFRGRTT
jgi:hypothetical protein